MRIFVNLVEKGTQWNIPQACKFYLCFVACIGMLGSLVCLVNFFLRYCSAT